jgi:hypothetical protein
VCIRTLLDTLPTVHRVAEGRYEVSLAGLGVLKWDDDCILFVYIFTEMAIALGAFGSRSLVLLQGQSMGSRSLYYAD